MLLAHSLYSYYGGPLYVDNSCELRAGLLSRFEGLAYELKVHVYGIVNAPEERSDLLEALRLRGYAVRYLSSTMYLPIRWTSFDEYLATFRSKRRRLIGAAHRKAEELGVSAELVGDPGDIGGMVAMAENILRDHGHIVTNLYPVEYMRAIVDEMGDRAKFLLVRDPHGNVLCFFLVLDFGGCLTPWVAGIEYDSLRLYEPYHYAYRWLINYAATQGYKEIDMGRGSYRFKQRYGFHRRILYLALNTHYPSRQEEVDRWSNDLAEYAARSYARHFT
jgi:predicted N-acyltransferase